MQGDQDCGSSKNDGKLFFSWIIWSWASREGDLIGTKAIKWIQNKDTSLVEEDLGKRKMARENGQS